jgi:PKD repeat protein
MYIPHVPEPSFDSDDICLGDVAQFKNTSTLKGADYIVTQWEFDDPDPAVTDDNSDIKDGFWKYTTYGNDVYVKMTVANGVYPKFTYFDVDTINITPKPLVDFKVLNACEGSPIVIRNSTTLPVSSTIDYSWDFGGEYTTTGKDPSYTFSTPGQRKISVTATANGCFASLTKNAYQFEMPMAEFTSEGECNFVNVDFINGSTIENGANMGYSWDFDGEGISREINPSFAFAKSGTKSVTLTATSEFGCVNKFSKSIVLQESPEADFAWDAACNLTPINFSITGSLPNGGANSSFEWDFAGESSAAQADPSYLFSKVGSKMVKLTISDLNGCSSSIEKEVNVVLQAVADFEAGSVCEGEEAVFTNKSTVAAGNLTYEWTFGDGASSSDLSPTHSYTDAKSYNVKLKAIVDGGCSDEVTYPVVVNPTPDATFTLAKDGRTVVCDGPQGNDIYRWTFGDGSKDDSEDPTYTFENVDQGTFTVCLATKKGECWNDKCEDITINLAGIENLTQNDDMIIVYPNPTNGKFNVTVENAGEVVVKVGDILGNLLDVNVTDNMNGTYSVDMSVVADGVYFVQVKNGDYFATKRITVSK